MLLQPARDLRFLTRLQESLVKVVLGIESLHEVVGETSCEVSSENVENAFVSGCLEGISKGSLATKSNIEQGR